MNTKNVYARELDDMMLKVMEKELVRNGFVKGTKEYGKLLAKMIYCYKTFGVAGTTYLK